MEVSYQLHTPARLDGTLNIFMNKYLGLSFLTDLTNDKNYRVACSVTIRVPHQI
jgi:hypothetical protein